MPRYVSKRHPNNIPRLKKSNLNQSKIFQKYINIGVAILPIIILILFAIKFSLLALILSAITIVLIVFKIFLTLCNKKIIPKTKQKTLGLIIFFVLLIVLSPSIIFINNLIVKTTIYNVLLPGDGRRTLSHYLNIPDTSTVFIIGNIISYNPRFPHVILSINNKHIVIVNKKNDSLFVSLKILNDKGIIAEIVNNKFTINPQNKFRIETPNKHTFKVYNPKGIELLDVEYLNKFTAKFVGQFYYFGVYISITDKGVYYNNVKVSDKVQGFMKQDLSF